MAAPEGRRIAGVKVCFFRSEKPREGLLADAFVRGLIEHGDDGVVRRLTGETQLASDCEVAVMFGVKSREAFHANWGAGVHTIMLDKGYTRHRRSGPVKTWEYHRVAVDGHQPTAYLGKVNHPSDRFERLGLEVKPWRASGEHILLAGSSQKYHDFYGISDPTRFWTKAVKRLSGTEREIVYRPKPSWRDAVPIEGTRFSDSGETIADVLAGAHAMVTHGSNACFEAMLAGVPAIVLGDGVTKKISSTRLEDIESPRLAGDEERTQLLCNLAYSQFTLSEFASGEAWSHIRPIIYG